MIGMWHVRGGLPLTIVLLVVLALVISAPVIAIPISVVADQPVRGLGTMEIAAIVLAACLPALSAPTFHGREQFSSGSPRLAHTAFTLAVLLTPLLILPVWRLGVYMQESSVEMPPVIGFAGTLVVYSTVGTLLFLLAGRTTSILATPLLSIAFVVGQQAWPNSILTAWWPTPRDWSTNWVFVAIAIVVTGAMSWAQGSVPRRQSV